MDGSSKRFRALILTDQVQAFHDSLYLKAAVFFFYTALPIVLLPIKGSDYLRAVSHWENTIIWKRPNIHCTSLLDCLFFTITIPAIMTTQDNTRTQEQTSTTGTSHGCISGNGREPIGEGNTDKCLFWSLRTAWLKQGGTHGEYKTMYCQPWKFCTVLTWNYASPPPFLLVRFSYKYGGGGYNWIRVISLVYTPPYFLLKYVAEVYLSLI